MVTPFKSDRIVKKGERKKKEIDPAIKAQIEAEGRNFSFIEQSRRQAEQLRQEQPNVTATDIGAREKLTNAILQSGVTSNLDTARKQAEDVLRQRGQRAAELEAFRGRREERPDITTFEEFQGRDLSQGLTDSDKNILRERGFTEEDIALFETGEMGGTGQVEELTGDDIAALFPGSKTAKVSVGLLLAGLGKKLGREGVEVAGSQLVKRGAQETIRKGSKKKMGTWMKRAGGLVITAIGLGSAKEILDIPNDRIDEMESQAGKVGEYVSEAFNLARAGKPGEAEARLNEAYDMILAFDSATVEFANKSLKAKINPEYIDNARYEYFKSLNEITTALQELEVLIANPPEEDVGELFSISREYGI